MDRKDLQQASLLISEPFELEVELNSDQELTDQLTLLKQALADRIYYLLTHNTDQLKGILYRIDVAEQKVLKIVSELSLEESALAIAGLIIDRQLEKVETRRKYSRGANNELSWDV